MCVEQIDMRIGGLDMENDRMNISKAAVIL
jgi:hypothetical protein